ncbi:hypothetical protein ACWEFJ_38070 [Actinosynnema sp. NPDC004786]
MGVHHTGCRPVESANTVGKATPRRSRALTCFQQAVFALRWFRESRDVPALAHDHGISRATGYRYLPR